MSKLILKKTYISVFKNIPVDMAWRPLDVQTTAVDANEHICCVGSESHLRSRERRECTRPSQLSASQKRT